MFGFFEEMYLSCFIVKYLLMIQADIRVIEINFMHLDNNVILEWRYFVSAYG